MRLAAMILVALSALLLVNVLVPQAATDPEGFARLARSGPVARWLLKDAGLGRISTSPLFVATLGAFFVNLTAVLIERTGTTIRRLRLAPPSDAQVRGMAQGGLELRGGAAVDRAAAARLLEQLGFRTANVGPHALWGVKHRLALLGFPLFHASFLVLAAGGVQLYLTRDVSNLGGAEGQEIPSTAGTVVRRAPLGPPPDFRLLVDRVDPRLEAGSPVDLAVSLRRTDIFGPAQVARVNAPATWGPLTVLVERVGIAPVLWAQDANGFTHDRVAVITARMDLPARVRLAGTTLEAVVEPIPMGVAFPQREELSTVAVKLRLVDGGREVFDGSLRRGEAVRAGEVLVMLDEARYWVGIRAVSERGGGLLVAGFLLLVVGILWRMFWYRRDVVLLWADDVVRLGGRAEFNPGRFREELRDLSLVVSTLGGGESRANA